MGVGFLLFWCTTMELVGVGLLVAVSPLYRSYICIPGLIQVLIEA
jgi:hypothetical protein